MLDERFSATEFEKLGRNTPESDALAQLLADVIAQECVSEVRAAGEKVASSLRRLGHQVREVAVEPYGAAFCVTFVDAAEGEDRHRLRFNLDLVVGAGYPSYKECVEGGVSVLTLSPGTGGTRRRRRKADASHANQRGRS